jgi:3-isopropylmalate dehydrogenase
MNLKILLLPGDGIGVDVTRAAVEVLEAVAKKFNHTLQFSEGLIGGIAIHKTGGRCRRTPSTRRWPRTRR